jgi:hypothetical protein
MQDFGQFMFRIRDESLCYFSCHGGEYLVCDIVGYDVVACSLEGEYQRF